MFTPYEGTEPYIFTSYSHKDSETVLPVLEEMYRAGYRIWYDEGIPWTSEWPAVIQEHLSACAVCLAFHSSASVESKHCRREVNFADHNGKPILSVYLEDVELRHGLGLQLNTIQSVRYNGTDSFMERLEQEAVFTKCREIQFVPEVPAPEPEPEHIAEAEQGKLNETEENTADVEQNPFSEFSESASKICDYGSRCSYKKAIKFYLKGAAVIIVSVIVMVCGLYAHFTSESYNANEELRSSVIVFSCLIISFIGYVSLKNGSKFRKQGDEEAQWYLSSWTYSKDEFYVLIFTTDGDSGTTVFRDSVPEDIRRYPSFIIIKSGVKQIARYSFIGSYNEYYRLFQVIIADSVIEIGDFAFQDCKLMKKIEIPDSVIRIGEGAFSGCTRLFEVSVPAHTEIAANAFPPWTNVTRRE